MPTKNVPVFSLKDLKNVDTIIIQIKESLRNFRGGKGSIDSLSGEISKLMDIYLNLQKNYVSVSILGDISEIFNIIESFSISNEKDEALMVYTFNKRINELEKLADDIKMKIKLIEMNYIEIPDGILFSNELNEALIDYQCGNFLSSFLLIKHIFEKFLTLSYEKLEEIEPPRDADLISWALDKKIIDDKILIELQKFPSYSNEEITGYMFSLISDMIRLIGKSATTR